MRFFIDDAVNKDRKKNVYSGASITDATVIPMSAIFPLVTDAYRSAEAMNKNVKSTTAILV